MSRYMEGHILMDVIFEKYPNFLNMEHNLSRVDPLFLVYFMEKMFKDQILPRGWEPNTSLKVFVTFNSGDIKMRITFTLGGIYHHEHSWWMGPFNNFTSTYISWVVLKLKNFSFTKNQVLSLPMPIIFFVCDNMEQYLSLLDDVRIFCAKTRMNKELQHDDFHDMSTSKLVNYLCRADLEANQKLLEAQKVNMENRKNYNS
jgi:hypothetical protein